MTYQEQFVKNMLPHAKAIEQATGFSYLIPLTQAALESDWGQKAVGNNFFGIKDTDGINGNEQLITTTEYLSTPNVKFPKVIRIVKLAAKRFKYTVQDWFRKYKTPQEAFSDHVAFFLRNPRYRTAIIYKAEPDRFFMEIAKAGYATAADYGQTLIQVKKSVIKRLPK